MLLEVLSSRPGDAVAALERISASVKQRRFAPEVPGSKDSARVRAYQKSIARLAAGESKEEDGEGESGSNQEESLSAPRADAVADLDSQAAAWACAGVTFDASDLFKLQLSLARLAGADESIQTLRLWGKLHGRGADYFVAEGLGGAALEEEAVEGREEPEEAANKHNYWVCAFPGAPWKQLPAVRPSQIQCARSIKRFLTGDLSAQVLGYPSFPGQEKEYVRAIIALVNEDCAVAPKGFLVASEDGQSAEVAEDFTMPSADELSDPAGWQTFGQAMSSLGRVAPLVTQDDEGNDVSQPEGWELQPLRDLDAEAWTVRRYPQAMPGAKCAKAILRSKKWPGAVAVAAPSMNLWTNIYVGFGYAKSAQAYTPPMPPPLQSEFDVSGIAEQPDVTEDTKPAEATEEEE